MRLDEPEHVDMVLGDCARDLGATCELILGRGHRGPGGVRPPGSRPGPGAGPYRMGVRRRYPGTAGQCAEDL